MTGICDGIWSQTLRSGLLTPAISAHLGSLRIWWCTAVQPTHQHSLSWGMQRLLYRARLPARLVSVRGLAGTHLVAHGSLLSAGNGHYQSLVAVVGAPATWIANRVRPRNQECSSTKGYLKRIQRCTTTTRCTKRLFGRKNEPMCGGAYPRPETCKQGSRGVVLVHNTYG